MNKRIISIIMALALILSALACAEESAATDYEAYAGLYTYLGYFVDRQFVVDEEMISWSVNLKKDGTGYLYWGEDNQGPISEWSMEDGYLLIHAGISEIEGTIANHVMLLLMGDGIAIGWAGPGTDFDKLNLITMDQFISEHREEIEAASEEDNALPREQMNG